MSMNELQNKIKEYREMKRLAEEAQAVADSILKTKNSIVLQATIIHL